VEVRTIKENAEVTSLEKGMEPEGEGDKKIKEHNKL